MLCIFAALAADIKTIPAFPILVSTFLFIFPPKRYKIFKIFVIIYIFQGVEVSIVFIREYFDFMNTTAYSRLSSSITFFRTGTS